MTMLREPAGRVVDIAEHRTELVRFGNFCALIGALPGAERFPDQSCCPQVMPRRAGRTHEVRDKPNSTT